MDRKSYLTIPEAAHRVGRTHRTIRRWLRAGDLPGALRLKAQVLIPIADLEALYVPAGPTREG